MASIAKILVPVSGTQRDASALATAFEAARPFNAHVEALFVHPDPREAVPAVGVPFSLEAMESMIGGQEQFAQALEKAARQTLVRVGGEAGVGIVETPAKADAVTCFFRKETGLLASAVAARSRLSDLVVFPPMRLDGFVDIIEAFLKVLTAVGRPALVATETAPAGLARSAAIAWDGSAAAARAVRSAMPFLQIAKTVHVLSATRGTQAAPCVDDLQQYLALHGIGATQKTLPCGAHGVGEALAGGAADLGADLLVMGGYGHSHLRETFFGGATADILSRATMPVFLAH